MNGTTDRDTSRRNAGDDRSPEGRGPHGFPVSDDDAYLRKASRRRSQTWVFAIVAVVVVVALVGGAYAAGWIGKSGTSPSTQGYCAPGSASATLTGAGSTFVYPLMNVWTTDYQSACGTSVNYNAVGSGSGISQLTARSVQFGASDAPLSYSQTSQLPAPAVTMPDSGGAVAILYNLPGIASGQLNLSVAVVANIYLGVTTNWNDSSIASINPGLKMPNLAITVVHRSDGSGTTFAFTSWLASGSSSWVSNIGPPGTTVNWKVGQVGASGSPRLANTVSTTSGAIGYAELNYAKLNGGAGGVPYAKIQNPAGNYIWPNATNTATAIGEIASSLPAPTGNWSKVTAINQAGAQTYPIATLTYIVVYQDLGHAYGSGLSATQAAALASFLWWITHTGQASATGLFYVELPASIVHVDETAIGDLQYNGATLKSH